jgi:hypothetical protein
MPVVRIYLGDGTVYDLCRVVGISETWVAAAYFREPANCDDVEVAFLHLSTIARVTLTLPKKTARPIGFGAMPAEWLAESQALHAATDAAA